MALPTDFGHKTYALHGKMKAEEYRCLSMFLFFILADCAPKIAKDTFLLFGIVAKACLQPTFKESFSTGVLLEDLVHALCVEHQKCFGKKNQTYNMHLVSHLHRIREKAPLNKFSAFRFEHFYGIMKMTYNPNTMSIGKQAMIAQQRRNHDKHQCRKSLKLGTRRNPRIDNSMVYTAYGVYKLTDVSTRFADGFVYGHKFITNRSTITIKGMTVPLDEIGIYDCDISKDIDRERFARIKVDNILGKVIAVEGKLICIPKEILWDH